MENTDTKLTLEIKIPEIRTPEIPSYVKPEVEDLELDEGVTPEMWFANRSGMGNCKHTYI